MKEQFGDARTVSGIGDDAIAIGTDLHVLQGTTQLTIGGDVSADAVQTLARTALGRLP
jgi:hypothetical protein